MGTQLNLPIDDDTILREARPKLVAFSGRAGSGKSVCADALVSKGWIRVKFADSLKNMLRSLYGTAGLNSEEIERRIEGDLKEAPDPFLNGQTPRWAMQSLGQEWGRDLIAMDLWTSLWTQRVLHEFALGYNVVVDDCRYVNEVAAIHRLSGVVVEVTRPAGGKTVGTHPSEQFEFSPDVQITNDAGIGDLAMKAVKFAA